MNYTAAENATATKTSLMVSEPVFPSSNTPGICITLLVAALSISTGASASPMLLDPITMSVVYDAPAGSPPATDICFNVGSALSYNAFNTVSLDLADTGPGSPVKVQAGVEGGPTSQDHPNQICFYFPETPIQMGETLNITFEAGSGTPIDGGGVEGEWTFAQDLGEFKLAHRAPPAIPPIPFNNGVARFRVGPFAANELHPDALDFPGNVQVVFNDDQLFMNNVPEPGSLALLALGLAGLGFSRRRKGVRIANFHFGYKAAQLKRAQACSSISKPTLLTAGG